MRFLFAFIVTLMLCSGCSNDPAGSQTIKQGEWSGCTDDSNNIIFSVNGDSVKNLTFTLNYTFYEHPDTSVTWTFDAAITDNGFEYQKVDDTGNWEFGLTMNGDFDPPEKINGYLDSYAKYSIGGTVEEAEIGVTWSASAH